MAQRISIMTGNEAVVEGALAAGCRFFAGYPITPSNEIAAILSSRLPAVGGKFLQMEDELGSMGAVIGASLTGLKALTASSGPGISLKQENIGFACMTEVPCVVVNVMRVGPSTGIPTYTSQGDVMQARWGTHGDHPVIALIPASVRELYLETVRAFNLAERFRTPVLLLSDEMLGHMSERVDLPDPADLEIVNRVKPAVPPDQYYPYDSSQGDIPPMASFFEGYRFHVTGLTHDRSGFPTEDFKIAEAELARLHRKIARHLNEILSFEEYRLEDAEVAIFAYGSVSRAARMAVNEARAKGIKVGLFRPLTLWPFPEEALSALAARVGSLIVAEQNFGQMIYEVERVVAGRARIEGVHRANGLPIAPKDIESRIRQKVREVA